MPHTTEDLISVVSRIDERTLNIADDLVALRRSIHEQRDTSNGLAMRLTLLERSTTVAELKVIADEHGRQLSGMAKHVETLMTSYNAGQSRWKAIGGTILQIVAGVAVGYFLSKLHLPIP